MRQIVLDTETTGLDPRAGHRIIEIGCVELIDRRLTQNRFHQYIQPDREIDPGAVKVHGITGAMLADQPRFAEVAEEFLRFVAGAELIIHNAPFDVGFLNHELARWRKEMPGIQEQCSVIDTLALARQRHPAQRNSLDALCKRYGIDHARRELHGALLDAELLAEVYLAMTGGQVALHLGGAPQATPERTTAHGTIRAKRPGLRVVPANESELTAHQAFLLAIQAANAEGCVWVN